MLRDSYLIVWHMFSHETMQRACICEWDDMIKHWPAHWPMPVRRVLSYCCESRILWLSPVLCPKATNTHIWFNYCKKIWHGSPVEGKDFTKGFSSSFILSADYALTHVSRRTKTCPNDWAMITYRDMQDKRCGLLSSHRIYYFFFLIGDHIVFDCTFSTL